MKVGSLKLKKTKVSTKAANAVGRRMKNATSSYVRKLSKHL